jgi:hypothetical protein
MFLSVADLVTGVWKDNPPLFLSRWTCFPHLFQASGIEIRHLPVMASSLNFPA